MWRLAVFLGFVGLLQVAALTFGTWGQTPDGRPRWDEGQAQALVGKTLIIGLTYEDASGETQRREQLHGRIVGADSENGFAVELAGPRRGETYRLPPQLENIRPAPPGEYRLRSTGEVIVDPDLLSNWVIDAPKN